MPVLNAGIKQSCDMRMIEPRKQYAFAGEAARQGVARQVNAQQLDRHRRLVQAVAPHRAPHLAHAALPEAGFQRPRAEFAARFVADLICHIRLGKCFAQHGIKGRLRERCGLVDVGCGDQQCHQFAGHLRLVDPQRADVGNAFTLVEFEHFVEQVRHALPQLGRQLGEFHGFGHLRCALFL